MLDNSSTSAAAAGGNLARPVMNEIEANLVKVAYALNEHSKAVARLREQFAQLASASSTNFGVLSKAASAANERLARLETAAAESLPQIEAMKVHAESFPYALRAARLSDSDVEEVLEKFESRLRELESGAAPGRAESQPTEIGRLKKKRAARGEAFEGFGYVGSPALRLKMSPHVHVVSDIEMREARRDSLNRLCNMVDWRDDGELSPLMKSLNEPVTLRRKSWEYALCIHGLEKLGVVNENSRALAVGAASEAPLFYFANRTERMVATDIYSEDWPDCPQEMLTCPEKYAPFPYRKDHLEVFRMGGDDLKFADNAFDFVFTLSSIEHFGSREKQRKSLEEMRRVVKPGGVIAIATEFILNDARHPEYFTFSELEQIFLQCKGLRLVGGDLDLRIEKSRVEYPIMLASTKNLPASPHTVLFAAGVMWTSVMMFLQKSLEPEP